DVEFARVKPTLESEVILLNDSTEAEAHNPFGFLLQPSSSTVVSDILRNANNFSTESQVDVLYCFRNRQEWKSAVDDDGIMEMLAGLNKKAAHEPAMLAFVINLEGEEQASYHRKASISSRLVQTLVDRFSVHGGFLFDLVGRPNYWSSAGFEKEGGAYEFFCQHPRWMQHNRTLSSGRRSPCSIYMHCSPNENLSMYLIAAERGDTCVDTLQQQLGFGNSMSIAGSKLLTLAVESPFLLHALILGNSFEQAKIYTDNVRDRVMGQVLVLYRLLVQPNANNVT
ncbi:hypothetical protein LTS18_004810, partial [Coniosporium uncinatum]